MGRCMPAMPAKVAVQLAGKPSQPRHAAEKSQGVPVGGMGHVMETRAAQQVGSPT